MINVKSFLSLLIGLLVCHAASAQRWSVGMNAADLLSLGTFGVEGSVAANGHITVNAEARINPWTFNRGKENQLQDRKQSYAVGMRWWPGTVYSGWWLGADGRYEQYNRGGIFGKSTEEGDAAGLGLSGGYSLTVAPHLNMDFGVGLWGGHTWYTTYACPTCGKVTDEGKKWFVLPSKVIMALVYVF